MTLEKPEYCTGSGIIIYLDNRENFFPDLEQDILYLFLKCNDKISKKYANKLDFPKGAIDKGEFSLECAIRETQEEIGYSKNDYVLLEDEDKNYYRCESGKGLIMYIAEIKKDCIGKAKLCKNPKTEIYEHKEYYWAPYDERVSNLPRYLQKSLDWAHSILLNK